MSLIHEALRKARRESGEEESRGVVYARGLTGRGRSGLGRGIALGILLTVALGAGIGAVLWIGSGAPGRSPQHAAGAAPPPDRRPEPVALVPADAPLGFEPTPTVAQTSPTDDQPLTGAPAAAEAGASAPRDEPTRSTADGPPPGPVAAPAPAPRPTRPFHTTPDGDRVYEVEADVGYATLTLDYIAYRPTDPFAQINGMGVRVGSSVEGFTVEEIGPSSVRLRDSRGALVLRVP